MTLRKLSAFVPSALVVAVGAHVAAAGIGHAPGGDRAGNLIAWTGAWLAVGLFGAFLSGLLGIEASPSAGSRRSIATRRRRGYGVVALGLAGTAAYAAVEVAEGHLAAGGVLRALVASFPLATVVAALARAAGSVAVRAGSRLGRLVERAVRRGEAPVQRFRRARPVACVRLTLFSGGGRAPPLFV
jgi:hypothetical protein